MVVRSSGNILVCPLVVCRLKNVKRFAFRLDGILKIVQLVAVVVVPADLPDAEVLSIAESFDFCLIRLLVEELERSVLKLVTFKVEHSDSVFPRLDADGLLFVKHTEGVHKVLEGMLPDDLSLFTAVNNAVFSKRGHSHEDKGVVTGRIEIQYFLVLFFEFDVGFAL